jgi:hypothetical protein
VAFGALHIKPKSTDATTRNLMHAVADVETSVSAAWRRFSEVRGRKTVRLQPRPTPLFVVLLAYAPALALIPVLGISGPVPGEPLLPRVLLTLFAIAVLWLGSFGFSRGKSLVFGGDGVCLGDGTFVAYGDILRCAAYAPAEGQPPLGVELTLRDGGSAIIWCEGALTVGELLRLFAVEMKRAAAPALAPAPPLEALSFREAAPRVPWANELRKAPSKEARIAILRRVDPAETPRLRVLLEETADPELEAALRRHLGS